MNFRQSILGVALVSAGFLTSCGDKSGDSTAKGTVTDSLSYAYGMLLGKDLSKNFESQKLDINSADFIAALGAAVKKDSAGFLMDDKTAQKVMDDYGKKRQADEMKKMDEQAVGERTKEGQWFAQNVDNNPDVKKTSSGLRYEVIKEGKGAKPTITDIATVHYKGALTNGQVFDSSEGKDPATFPVGQVIPGWTEALQIMSVGSKYKLYIPFDLGYGARGAGQGQIPPFATLVFDVELLKVDAGTAPSESGK